jgi:hypothetical protein
MSTETNYDPDCLLIPITENTEILKNKAIKVENDEKKYLITTIEEVIDEGIEGITLEMVRFNFTILSHPATLFVLHVSMVLEEVYVTPCHR